MAQKVAWQDTLLWSTINQGTICLLEGSVSAKGTSTPHTLFHQMELKSYKAYGKQSLQLGRHTTSTWQGSPKLAETEEIPVQASNRT